MDTTNNTIEIPKHLRYIPYSIVEDTVNIWILASDKNQCQKKTRISPFAQFKTLLFNQLFDIEMYSIEIKFTTCIFTFSKTLCNHPRFSEFSAKVVEIPNIEILRFNNLHSFEFFVDKQSMRESHLNDAINLSSFFYVCKSAFSLHDDSIVKMTIMSKFCFSLIVKHEKYLTWKILLYYLFYALISYTSPDTLITLPKSLNFDSITQIKIPKKITHSVVAGSRAWWRNTSIRSSILSLIESDTISTPSYIYSLDYLSNNIETIKTLFHSSVENLYYAMKANTHPIILSMIYQKGINFETVSIDEISLLQQSVKNMDMNRVLFTPNFISDFNLKKAFSYQKSLPESVISLIISNEFYPKTSDRSQYEKWVGSHDSKYGINITLDSMNLLINHPYLFRGKRIFARIDPPPYHVLSADHGHHEKVQTSGVKFGIPSSSIDLLVQETQKIGCMIVGLHTHVGSGIEATNVWSHILCFLSGLLFRGQYPRFPHLRYLNLGGGIPVPYKPLEKYSLSCVSTSILKARKQFLPKNWNLQIFLEPGRLFVAQCGAIFTRVLGTKTKPSSWNVTPTIINFKQTRPRTKKNSFDSALLKSNSDIINTLQPTPENQSFLSPEQPRKTSSLARKSSDFHQQQTTFVGCDAGMNTLIRPTLYDAYHYIENYTKGPPPNPETSSLCHIVGQICETGDYLGYSIPLSSFTEPNDTLIICTAGAYGSSMTLHYNLQGFPMEYFI